MGDGWRYGAGAAWRKGARRPWPTRQRGVGGKRSHRGAGGGGGSCLKPRGLLGVGSCGLLMEGWTPHIPPPLPPPPGSQWGLGCLARAISPGGPRFYRLGRSGYVPGRAGGDIRPLACDSTRRRGARVRGDGSRASLLLPHAPLMSPVSLMMVCSYTEQCKHKRTAGTRRQLRRRQRRRRRKRWQQVRWAATLRRGEQG